jgi:hypothetical protein
MTDPAQEKEYGPADPVAASNAAETDEPLDVDREEKDDIEITTPPQSSSHTLSEKEHEHVQKKKPELRQTKSYATTTSAATRTESNVEPKKKPWYKNYNPLRWGGIPPVPETRQVSREYNAPFLSLVYFQWMAPLMSVSSRMLFLHNYVLICAGWIQAATRAK